MNKIGIAIHPFKVGKYSNDILHLLNNEQERLALGKNSYEWAQNHQWDTTVDIQGKFYFECLEKEKLQKTSRINKRKVIKIDT